MLVIASHDSPCGGYDEVRRVHSGALGRCQLADELGDECDVRRRRNDVPGRPLQDSGRVS